MTKDELFHDENEGALVRKCADTIINLLAAHWAVIRSLADDSEAEGAVKVAANITFHFDGKAPCAGVDIAFAPLKTKDGATVFLDDPDQLKMPGIDKDKSTVTISTPGVKSVTLTKEKFSNAVKILSGKNAGSEGKLAATKERVK